MTKYIDLLDAKARELLYWCNMRDMSDKTRLDYDYKKILKDALTKAKYVHDQEWEQSMDSLSKNKSISNAQWHHHRYIVTYGSYLNIGCSNTDAREFAKKAKKDYEDFMQLHLLHSLKMMCLNEIVKLPCEPIESVYDSVDLKELDCDE